MKVDYKKAQFYAQNAIKGYGSGLLGRSYFRTHASARLRDEKGFETSAQDLQACGSHVF